MAYVKGRRNLRTTPTGQADTKSPIVGLWDIEPRLGGTTLARLEGAYLSGLEAYDKMDARAKEHAASGRYTADGIKQALLGNAMSEAVPDLYRARQTIKNAKSELAQLRARVRPPTPDKTDLVAAMRRAELRDWLRSKPQAERDKYIGSQLDRLDPEMALALMEMPHEVSGISEMQRSALVRRSVEQEHAGTYAEIADLERGIELAERSVEASRDEI
jgi:hypothetical protein